MPTAELFGKWVLPTLIRKIAVFDRVFAIGDCQPAVQVLNSLVSGKPMMRTITEAARGGELEWRGVHVKREFNLDCDRLSHPALWREVEADAISAELEVTRVTATEEEWQVLRDAIAHAHAYGGGRHAKHPTAAPAVSSA